MLLGPSSTSGSSDGAQLDHGALPDSSRSDRGGDGTATTLSYPIVGTAQTTCYGDVESMTCPAAGQPYYGQDAQQHRVAPSYTVSGDGLTVLDNVTGLTWQPSPDTSGDGTITAADKKTWTEAQARPAVLNAAKYGGFSDWRLPTIKELYSLILFSGTDLYPPPSPSSAS